MEPRMTRMERIRNWGKSGHKKAREDTKMGAAAQQTDGAVEEGGLIS